VHYRVAQVLRKPPHTQTLRLMYYMTAWLMPLAVTFRLVFAAFIFLSLRCKCDHTLSPPLAPDDVAGATARQCSPLRPSMPSVATYNQCSTL
jgi:hypothetical protein